MSFAGSLCAVRPRAVGGLVIRIVVIIYVCSTFWHFVHSTPQLKLALSWLRYFGSLITFMNLFVALLILQCPTLNNKIYLRMQGSIIWHSSCSCIFAARSLWSWLRSANLKVANFFSIVRLCKGSICTNQLLYRLWQNVCWANPGFSLGDHCRDSGKVNSWLHGVNLVTLCRLELGFAKLFCYTGVEVCECEFLKSNRLHAAWRRISITDRRRFSQLRAV